tara:strand:+ start:54 stop:464 length:411 start_codon:yes stop_codon:yes gene_type:complete
MSREIKFRVWSVIRESWVHPVLDITNYFKLSDNENRIIEQYTGLKDKSGKEIYEGDIIKFHTGMKYRDSINTKICFNEGCFGFRSLNHDGKKTISGFIPFSAIRSSLENNNIWLDVEEVLEVTGNIHENNLTQIKK